ncbi:unnamed protein product [Prorocentrum cordatum]|uniref:Uncharacterized protein n=1 Tax=Prorocentrum cordatum TaxID=2364126 RepID=A0ABN9XE75_9DINO|nr:unnamed protein product [Polarella glacialis]
MALRFVPVRAFVPFLASVSAVAGDEGVGGGRLLDDSFSLLSVDVRARPRPGPEAPQSWSWDSVSAWVRDNGGSGALSSLTTNETEHGGYRVRGVIAREPISSGTIILQIPQRLWLWLDNFPHVKEAELPSESMCSALSERVEASLRIAAAVAGETHKGQASFFYPWLQTLPTLDDFRAFHPRLASEAVLADFATLPLVQKIRRSQRSDEAVQACFEAWRQQPHSLVANLTWNSVHGALLLFQTRSYSVRTAKGTADAMIPLSEFLNTGRKEAMNTNWWPVRPNRDFKLKLLADVRAGATSCWTATAPRAPTRRCSTRGASTSRTTPRGGWRRPQAPAVPRPGARPARGSRAQRCPCSTSRAPGRAGRLPAARPPPWRGSRARCAAPWRASRGSSAGCRPRARRPGKLGPEASGPRGPAWGGQGRGGPQKAAGLKGGGASRKPSPSRAFSEATGGCSEGASAFSAFPPDRVAEAGLRCSLADPKRVLAACLGDTAHAEQGWGAPPP